jgi:hypothetical protein
MKLLKIIRRFERFNFHGVTELPEPMYESDNYALYNERLTARPVLKRANGQNHNESILIGYIKDDFVNKKESFNRVYHPSDNSPTSETIQKR